MNNNTDAFIAKYGQDAYDRIFSVVYGDAQYDDVTLHSKYWRDAINCYGMVGYLPPGETVEVNVNYVDGNVNGSEITSFGDVAPVAETVVVRKLVDGLDELVRNHEVIADELEGYWPPSLGEARTVLAAIPPKEPPTIAKMIGIAPDITGNLSTDEHVRVLRDGTESACTDCGEPLDTPEEEDLGVCESCLKRIRKAMRVEEMAPGPQLNALIEEHVFHRVLCDGWDETLMGIAGFGYIRNERCLHKEDECYPRECLADYSGSIAAAWQVAEKVCGLAEGNAMRKVELHTFAASPIGRTFCNFIDFDMNNGGGPVNEWEAYGQTPAHAICLCVLKAVGVTDIPDAGEVTP